jgi:hypothetical protein
MGHTILGITAPPPEHERAYLLGWILSLVFIIAFSIGLVFFLVSSFKINSIGSATPSTSVLSKAGSE